jgi:ElaB/YqjD/DUF883 family membrane-anchored ribosome-binding protein
MKEKMSDAASHVRNTASEYGKAAADNIDRNVRNAAGALENTANTLRSQAHNAPGRVSDFAQTAASKLDDTASYLKDFDTRQVMGQVEDWTRRNPGLAIVTAAAVGFVIGMSLRRDHSTY